MILVLCSTFTHVSLADPRQALSPASTAISEQIVFTPTGAMAHDRTEHTATLLGSGKVLVVGGGSITAELYDPATGLWTPTGSLAVKRFGHTATLLEHGDVLVAGGQGETAEIYHPATGTWSTTGSMSASRYTHTATLLNNGTVLVVGGMNATSLASAEVYDPTTGTWHATGTMSVPRSAHTATLLTDGSVLVAGGRVYQSHALTASAERYDPATGTWRTAGTMVSGHAFHTATLLTNGMVLIAGGWDIDNPAGMRWLPAAERYDPATDTWNEASPLPTARARHTATLLPNGNVLVIGGNSDSSSLTDVDVFDPSTDRWRPFGRIAGGGVASTATLLPSGDLLITGAFETPTPGVRTNAELGHVTIDTDSPTGTLTINSGARATTSPQVVLTVAAHDPSGAVAQLSLSNDGYTWEAWQPYTDTRVWTLTPGDGPKTVYVRLKDYAANSSLPIVGTILLDTAAGTDSGVSINGGALFTNQIAVALTLAAPAMTPLMMVSNDGGFAGATWEPYATRRSWQITHYGSSVLPRTVYVRYKDMSGTVFGPYQDDIILDTTPPTGSIEVIGRISGVLHDGARNPIARTAVQAAFTVFLPVITKEGTCPTPGTASVVLRLIAQDDVSGVADMLLSTTPTFACAQWERYAPTTTWPVAATEATTVYVRFRDHAGNPSPVATVVTLPDTRR